jgi:hypothetical protein
MIAPALAGAVLLSLLSTAADYVWFLNIPRHQLLSGAIHGAALFGTLGAYLGWRKGHFLLGKLGGLASGLVAAASFYALAPLAGYSAMLVSWWLVWVMLAAVQSKLEGGWDTRFALARGTATAVAAALGFTVVLFSLYRGWPPDSFPAAKHLASWVMAYLPGLYVLMKPKAQRRD